MYTTTISIIAITLYICVGLLLFKRLTTITQSSAKANILTRKNGLVIIGLLAAILHANVLYIDIFMASGQGLNFGFFNAGSLVTWLIVVLLLVAAFSKPVENLGILILPLAALSIVLASVFQSHRILETGMALNLRYHILLSFFAYSLLSIAAVQAVLLAVQNKYLRNKHPGGLIRSLPPLETMEFLLFQMIAMGFLLMSLSLITGFVYLEDMFLQHLVHKTVLSIVAWIVFGILLWGRWKFGWRGKTAIRWTLSGFVFLLLSYFGSKLVSEIFLNRS